MLTGDLKVFYDLENDISDLEKQVKVCNNDSRLFLEARLSRINKTRTDLMVKLVPRD